jgi:hypothetical protein
LLTSLTRLVAGLIALGVLIAIVVIGVPLIIAAVVAFFAFAIGFALWIILRAKVRSWLGLPPKPILGARARMMRQSRGNRSDPMHDAYRENVRVRTPQGESPASASSSDAFHAHAHTHAQAPRPRPDIIEGEASPSRETS